MFDVYGGEEKCFIFRLLRVYSF